MLLKILKHLLLWGLIAAVAVFIFIQLNKSPDKKDWQTYQKQKNELHSHPSTSKELAKVKSKSQPTKTAQKKVAKYKGRRIVNPTKKTIDWDNIEFGNKINPNWKDAAAKSLLRFQDQETKVLIHHKQSVIKIIKGKAYYVEVVIISYLPSSGKRTSFSAYVNSENGNTIEAWDRTRYENLPSRERMK